MKALLSAAFKTTGSAIVAGICVVVANKILATETGTTGFGLYTVLTTLVLAVAGVATFNGSTALVQGIASRVGRAQADYIVTTFTIFAVATMVAIPAMVLLAPWLTPLITGRHDTRTIDLVRDGGVAVGLAIIYGYVTGVLNGFRAIGWLAWVRIGGAVSTVALALPVAHLVRAGHVDAFIILLTLPFLAEIAISLRVASRNGWLDAIVKAPRGVFRRDAARGFASIAGTFFIVGQIGSLGFLLVTSLVAHRQGLARVGLLNAAWNLSMQYVTLVLSAFATYYLPMLAQARDDREVGVLIRDVARLTSLATVPLVTAMIVLKPFVIVTLYSASFLPTLHMVRWMLLGDYLKIAAWVVGTPAIARANMRTFFLTDGGWWIAFTAGSVFSVTMFHSLEGIGITFVGLYLAYLGYYVHYAFVKHAFRFDRRTRNAWLGGLAVLLVAAGYTWNQSRVEWPAAIAFIGIACLLSAAFLTPSERLLARSVVVRRLGPSR